MGGRNKIWSRPVSDGKDGTAEAHTEEGIHKKLKEGWMQTQWPAWLQGPERPVSHTDRIRGIWNWPRGHRAMGLGVTQCRQLVRKSIPWILVLCLWIKGDTWQGWREGEKNETVLSTQQLLFCWMKALRYKHYSPHFNLAFHFFGHATQYVGS